jgi:hypothetical protein
VTPGQTSVADEPNQSYYVGNRLSNNSCMPTRAVMSYDTRITGTGQVREEMREHAKASTADACGCGSQSKTTRRDGS